MRSHERNRKARFPIVGEAALFSLQWEQSGFNMANHADFSAQYKDPRWYQLRQRVFDLADNECESCGSTRNLQCHHKMYLAGHAIWEYDDYQLSCLCEDCHAEWHQAMDALKHSLLWIHDPVILREITGMLLDYRSFKLNYKKEWFTLEDRLEAYLMRCPQKNKDLRQLKDVIFVKKEVKQNE